MFISFIIGKYLFVLLKLIPLFLHLYLKCIIISQYISIYLKVSYFPNRYRLKNII